MVGKRRPSFDVLKTKPVKRVGRSMIIMEQLTTL